MKKMLSFFVVLLGFASQSIIAQNSSGNALYFDYMSWTSGGIYPPMYVDCGNNSTFNTANELTIEAWIRAFEAGQNQKIVGKMNDQLNNGYVMGIELLHNYSEIFNPSQNEINTGNMPLDSSWIHLATTYKAGDVMAAYINGVKVDEISVANSPIASNSNPLIIGVAPWDIHALQYFGHIDEVKVWNIARTEEQIKETMFKRLQGNETGLLAYYNFDASSGATVIDVSGNGNEGTVVCDEEDYWDWQASYAPVGDETMSSLTNVVAAWPGKGEALGPYAVTENGLSLLTNIQFKKDQYAVFGHNNLNGATSENFSANVPASFQRTSREWYINIAGNIKADMLFDLSNAASGGAELPSDMNLEYYTLFVRNTINDDYVALYSATEKNGDILTFKNVSLQNKFYTIGVGDENIAPTAGIEELKPKTEVFFYPNPAKNQIFLKLENINNSFVEIFNISGQRIASYDLDPGVNSIDVSGLACGAYIISLNNTIYEQIFIID